MPSRKRVWTRHDPKPKSAEQKRKPHNTCLMMNAQKANRTPSLLRDSICVDPKVSVIDDVDRTRGVVVHSCSHHDVYWGVPVNIAMEPSSCLIQCDDAHSGPFDRLACPMGAPTLLYGHCRRTNAWRLCRIVSCCHHDSSMFTVMWTDGTLQNRTRGGTHLVRPHADDNIEDFYRERCKARTTSCSCLDGIPPLSLPLSDESHDTIPSVQGMSVWEAVRHENLAIALYLIDHEGVSPSAVCEQEPHTPLYWAVKQNSVDFVRELLERGASGEDAVKAASIPPLPVKQHSRRRPFFPGTVSRLTKRLNASTLPSEHQDRAQQLIRAMIMACRFDLRLPNQIYRNEGQPDCIVCCLRRATAIGLPCAHLACCRNCLEQTSRCPLCRAKVVAIAE